MTTNKKTVKSTNLGTKVKSVLFHQFGDFKAKEATKGSNKGIKKPDNRWTRK